MRAAPRPRNAPGVRRQPGARPRPERVPPAALLHDARRARALALAAPRPGLGRSRLRRGAHGRRSHPPPAQGARAFGPRPSDRDGARLGLPLLRPTRRERACHCVESRLARSPCCSPRASPTTRCTSRRCAAGCASPGSRRCRAAAASGKTRSPSCTGFCKRPRCRARDARPALTRFRAAVRALPDGVVILDRENHIEWVEPDRGAALRHRPAARSRAAGRQPDPPPGLRRLSRGRATSASRSLLRARRHRRCSVR